MEKKNNYPWTYIPNAISEELVSKLYNEDVRKSTPLKPTFGFYSDPYRFNKNMVCVTGLREVAQNLTQTDYEYNQAFVFIYPDARYLTQLQRESY